MRTGSFAPGPLPDVPNQNSDNPFSPIDLMSDVVPVLVMLAVKSIPKEVIEDRRLRAGHRAS